MRAIRGFTSPWGESTNAPHVDLRLNRRVNAACSEGLGTLARVMIRARAAALLLLAAPAGLACGDESGATDRFRDGYNQAIERLNEVNSNIQERGEELTAQPGAEIGREFDRIAATAARTRDDLAELEPPDDAREEFDDLLAAIEDGIRDIRAAADAARTEKQERFNAAAEQLSESGGEIARAEQNLKDAVESD
jgi:hypothetical protein